MKTHPESNSVQLSEADHQVLGMIFRLLIERGRAVRASRAMNYESGLQDDLKDSGEKNCIYSEQEGTGDD